MEGLRFGFKLKYTGTRLPVLTKKSKSVSEHNEVVCRKIKKDIKMGRVAGRFKSLAYVQSANFPDLFDN
jgi:hypothetical protein